MTDDAPGTRLSAENRYIGERYGNLEYHVKVLANKRHKVEKKLKRLNNKHSGDAKVKKQRDLLRGFKNTVSDRLEKIQKQVEGIKQHLDDEAVEFAEEVRETSMENFQRDGDEGYDTTFTPASERD